MAHQESNNLFPVFLKLETLNVLLVGAGNVGLEKLNAVLANSPLTKVKVVAKDIHPEFKKLASQHQVEIIKREFEPGDLINQKIVILATNNIAMDAEIKSMANAHSAIVNVADKPELCDFYLCSIVQKGNLKIGISTNGKSPTIAKRIKELLNQVIPEDLNQLLDTMNNIRNQLKGDFSSKVKALNKLTSEWSDDKHSR